MGSVRGDRAAPWRWSAWRGVSIAIVLAAALGTPLRAAGVVISTASLRGDRAGGNASGGLDLQALFTDQEAGSDLVQHLLSGQVAVSVRDRAAFDATVGLTDCLPLGGDRVRCHGAQARAWLDPAPPPYRYRLRIRVRRLGAAAAGAGAPVAPVTVAVQRPQPALRLGTVAACDRRGIRLRCEGGRRPNIVFIVTDDQRWDTQADMPSVQALAAEGVRFTNAFVPTPICGPSRASMLTGRYARHTGILTNSLPDGGAVRFVGQDASTLATWLHDAGYTTGMYGKYIVDYVRQNPPYTATSYVPPGWDDWQAFRNQGFFNYELVENGSLATYGALPADYSTDLIAARTVDFIENANGQPFFAHIGLAAPHSDGNKPPPPAPRHVGLYGAISPWRPPAYDEPAFADKPLWMQALPRAADPLGVYFKWGTWTDSFRRAQLRSLAAVDDAVGAIAAAVESTGEADNTVIVFTSDNGYLWGEHRVFTNKLFAFDESIRVPLIVRLPPGIGPARDEAALALNIDIAPTLAELAGVIPGAPVDGRSLVPLLRDQQPAWRDEFLLEYYSPPGGDVPTYVGVRTADWKYIEYPDEGEVELYDLAGDPHELVNLAGDPTHAATRAELAARLAALTGGL